MKYDSNYYRCSFCGIMLFEKEKNHIMKETKEGKDLWFCNSRHAELFFENNNTLDMINPEDFGSISTKEKNNIENDDIDPITLSVVNGAISSICKEMGKIMQRTSFSPIFFEGNDFTCTLFDSQLELIGQFEGNPGQLGAAKHAVSNAIKTVGIRNLDDGDVVIHNDPYLGSPHLPEFVMIKPIFDNKKIINYASIIAHHPDVGGKSPGSFPGDATEIIQEGIFVRPQKIFIKGVENDAVWELILSNVRLPHETYGDFMAMYASLIGAETMVRELKNKYGKEIYLKYTNEIINYVERMIKDEIRKIPNGIYEGLRMVDDDGASEKPYEIKISIKVCDEDIIFDCREVADSAKGPINCAYAVGSSGPINTIFNIIDPSLIRNEGAFRPLHFIIPEGKLLNAVQPSPVSGGNTETYNIISSTVMEAFSKAVPERCCAGSGETCTLITGGGFDKRKNNNFGIVIWEPTGWGGKYSNDGDSAVMTYCGLTAKTYSTEVIETLYPLRVLKYKLRDGSGGRGEYRGGLGVIREYEVLCDEFSFGAHSNRHKYPPSGIFGGSYGGRTEFKVTRDKDDNEYIFPTESMSSIKSNTKFSGILLKKGQKFIVKSPGGGGYGNPKERDHITIIEDLKNGYITKEQAIDEYKLPKKKVEEIIEKYWFNLND
jgi:N-methylhydantoinase B